MSKFKKFFIIFFLLFFSNAYNSDNLIFIENFIQDYGFKPRDRYTHEYNSAILHKTSISLDELEETLSGNNLNLAGRIIITGYEEQAFPSYFYRFKNPQINDEAQSKINSGWTLRLHNIFGFLTGFLFKDLNFYTNHWLKNKNLIIEHIDSNDIEIFDNQANIIHEHAFSDALTFMAKSEFEILKNLKKQDYKKIITELIKFWTTIYDKDVKVGNNKSAATQDILFSIEYANHILRSQLPLIKWYVGPDITYPIETSTIQSKQATIHAQKFTKIMYEQLKPIDNKPTVYIFCSFVDGVGKSTLLGNIKNYSKYEQNIENYERVDNSSSQLADLFCLKENTFIADLPAQVSHFTYKPDGYVYVNIGREKDIDLTIKNDLEKYVLENKEFLEIEFNQKISLVKNLINKSGYLSPELNNKLDAQKAFIKNLILIKKLEANRWISFSQENKEYIFNKFNPTDIRVLVKLKTVQSEGLKNIESEQMLFFKGVKFPLSYNNFTDDLIAKLKSQNIENIIFVDFTSMYPRSSRENVRINYLIQQLCLIDKNFDPELSLYRNFVSDSELLALLKNKEYKEKISHAFKTETILRLTLLNIINKQNRTNLTGVKFEEITPTINTEIEKIDSNELKKLQELVENKVKNETIKLEQIYGKTKNYLNIQQLSFPNLVLFSKYLVDLYSNKITNEKLRTIWQEPEFLINNDKLNTIYKFNTECKDQNLLTPMLSTLRQFWYSAIINLYNSKIINSENLELKKTIENIVPIFLNYGPDNKIYFTQTIYPKHEKIYDYDNQNEIDTKKKKKQKILKSNYFNHQKPAFVNINDKKYFLCDKNQNITNGGAFAFDNNNSKTEKNKKSAITFVVQKYRKDKPADFIITTHKLYKELKNSYIWEREHKKLLKTAIKNSQKNNAPKSHDNQNNQNKEQDSKQKTIVLGNAEQAPILQLIIRLLATVEMIAKDAESEIVCRFKNRKDFKATVKLLENVTLPKYFGIIYENKLFEDYNAVEPYPSWQAWENII